jgi:triacylglycerol lipase
MQVTTTWDDLLNPGKATDFFARREFPPFDPTTNEYSPVNALWLAELSRLIYRDPPIPLPPGNNFPSGSTYIRHVFFVDQGTDTQAMLVEFDGATPFAALVFRGTEQHIKDIKTDLMVGKITLGRKKVEVHEGFQIALDSVWGKIKPELDALTCPIFFTGHSLGAALATLAAAKLAPKALYTYGSPMVGNQAFASSLV